MNTLKSLEGLQEEAASGSCTHELSLGERSEQGRVYVAITALRQPGY